MPTDSIEHLWLVVTSPLDGRVLIVNLSTPRKYSDTTCILTEAEYPILRRKSFVYYEKAKIVKVSAIKEAIARGLFKKAGSPLEEILIRVCKGLLDSDDSSLKNKEFLKKCEQNQ